MKDPNGLSDPYCRVYLVGTDNVLHKTEIKPNTLDPEWKETFTLYGGELAPLLFSPGECNGEIASLPASTLGKGIRG